MLTQNQTKTPSLIYKVRHWVRHSPFDPDLMALVLVISFALLLIVNSGDLSLLCAVCWSMVFGLSTFAVIAATAKDDLSRQFLPKIFLWAYTFRVFTLMIIQNYLKAEINYDASSYETYGLMYSDFWRHISVTPPSTIYGPYSVFVGILYYVSGNNPYLPQIINAMVGALIPCVVYDICRRHFGGESVGRASAVIASLLTAWVIWSSIAMRDIEVILCIALVLREAVDLQDGITGLRCLRLLLWLAVIALFRPYVDLIFGIALGIAFTFTLARRPFPRIILGFCLLCCLGAAADIGGARAIAAKMIENQTEQLESTRQVVVYKADGEYGADVHYHDVGDVIRFLPVGLYNFLGGPFPWTFRGRQFIMAIPEWSSWYFIVYFGVRGFLFLNGKTKKTLPLVTFFVVGSLLLSVISCNFAISIRHRSMLSMSLVILSGAGWVQRRQNLTNRLTAT